MVGSRGFKSWPGHTKDFKNGTCTAFLSDTRHTKNGVGKLNTRRYQWTNPLTLLKPKRHSLRCHGFVVHTLLLRMHTNVVDFRVMRRLCHRQWNGQWYWQSVNHIPRIYDNGPRDHGVWRLTLTAYCSFHCIWQTCGLRLLKQREAPPYEPFGTGRTLTLFFTFK